MDYQSLIESIFLHPRPWILSGAGISTESGIADFRGPGGLWERIDPMKYFSVDALYKNPGGFYGLGIEMFDFMEQARPNQAHLVLGELQQKRIIGPIVTQNIDSLHQKGGANYVYEVHGHVRSATCTDCRKTVISLQELSRRVQNGEIPPRCSCGGLLKPDVILFGDAMPADYANARSMLNTFKGTSPAVIVVGSTLSVSPINMFPLEFAEMHIINFGKTELDRQASLRFEGKAGETMDELKSRLLALNGGQDLAILPAGFVPGLIISSLNASIRELETATRKGSSTKSERYLADALLARKILAAYPRRSERQPLEEYWLNSADAAAEELMARCPGGVKPARIEEGSYSFVLASLHDFASASYQAVEKYSRQPRYDNQVLEEIMLKFLGAAGLACFASQIAGLQEAPARVKILVDKIRATIAERNCDIDIEQALADI